ncbi:MAG TPA: hypothetical protein VMW25_01275 [Clostridia bacterium]|nr:hypothetical protein [Clostridia bacterium]
MAVVFLPSSIFAKGKKLLYYLPPLPKPERENHFEDQPEKSLSQTEKFKKRLKKSIEKMEKGLGSNKTEKIIEAMERIEEAQVTLDQLEELPPSPEPGEGTTGQHSRKIRRGKR